MACTKIISKACVLLLTSSLSSVGFASSTSGGDDIFGGKNGGGKLKGIWTQHPRALSKDFNSLYNNLNQISTATNPKDYEYQIQGQLINFFEKFSIDEDQLKSKEPANYINWLIDNKIIGKNKETPVWRDTVYNFITNKDQIIKDRKTEIEKALIQISNDLQKLEDGSHAKKRARGNFRDQPPLTTPRDDASKNDEDNFMKLILFIPSDQNLDQTAKAPPAATSGQATEPTLTEPKFPIPPAHEISNHLKRYIIGQDKPMSAIATHVFKHYAGLKLNKYIQNNPIEAKEKGWVPFDKSNMLLIGQSGCGKTASLEYMRDYLNEQGLDVKLIMGNASSLTRTGYVGPSVTGLIKQALVAHNYDIKKTQNRTIIFIDEVDKIGAKSEASGRDIAGADVQGELLRILQGDEVSIEIESERGAKKTYNIDTNNILFIAAGAFTGLKPTMQEIPVPKPVQSLVKKAEETAPITQTTDQKTDSTVPVTTPAATALAAETETKQIANVQSSTIESTQEKANVVELTEKKAEKKIGKRVPPPKIVTQKHFSIPLSELERFGLKRELLGRLHQRILFNPINQCDLLRIIIESENSVIKQFKSLLASPAYEINLEFTPESLNAIAEKAFESQTGARSLRSIMDELLYPILLNSDNLRGNKKCSLQKNSLN
jgi:ATP-dependent protease Clp ATPase subunit